MFWITSVLFLPIVLDYITIVASICSILHHYCCFQMFQITSILLIPTCSGLLLNYCLYTSQIAALLLGHVERDGHYITLNNTVVACIRGQVVEKDGHYFTLNNTRLQVCQWMETRGQCRTVRIETVPLKSVPDGIKRMMTVPPSFREPVPVAGKFTIKEPPLLSIMHRTMLWRKHHLHRETFTHTNIYTQKHIHTETYTHRNIYTQKHLHNITFVRNIY